jgi:hypothetical protein
MTTLPTRAQVDAAQPLDFAQTRGEKQCNIEVEIAPDGLHVRAEYTGSLSTIPGMIERLKTLGVVELVIASRPTPAAKNTKAQRVQHGYALDGSPVCPEHDTKLREGKWGWYCPHKDKATGEYCKLKFLD